MKIKYGIFLISCLLLLSMLNAPAIGCGCSGSPPGQCWICSNGSWVHYGNCWNGCGACSLCPDCWCISTGTPCDDKSWSCYDPLTQKCCGTGYGTVCYKNQTCCILRCCEPNLCEECVGGYCNNKCEPYIQFCCNGSCCDSGKCCENGQCGSTCWTTFVEHDFVPCPECSGFFTACEGSVPLIDYHSHWRAAAPGEVGWCKKPTKNDIVGYWYECKEDWDVTKIAECAAGDVVCHALCECTSFDCWVLCVGCLVVHSAECVLDGACSVVRDCITGQQVQPLQPIREDVVDESGDKGSYCFVFSQ